MTQKIVIEQLKKRDIPIGTVKLECKEKTQ